MKIAMAFSAALIVGVFLFFKSWRQEKLTLPSSTGTAAAGAPFVAGEQIPNASDGKGEAELLTARGRERLERLQQQRNEAQVELRSFLSGRSPDLEKSRQLLGARRKELLLQKVLLLGETSGSLQEMAEAERKRMLSVLDQEAKILEEQLVLLSQSSVRE